MISKKNINKIAGKTGLNLYQQEKDYLLKLFLYNYFKRFDHAVFKGGTCIKYIYGLNRFSHDLDFNLKTSPEEFRIQTKKTLKEINLLGINNHLTKDELFNDAYTCDIAFHGPLYKGTAQTRNKIRIDAGKRTGIINKPRWELITSEYPETPQNFLVLVMNEQEILAEKITALMERDKGRDLYDVWFLLKKGIKIDKKLLGKKAKKEHIKTKIKIENIPTKQEYERDIKKLTNQEVPYEQITEKIRQALSNL